MRVKRPPSREHSDVQRKVPMTVFGKDFQKKFENPLDKQQILCYNKDVS